MSEEVKTPKVYKLKSEKPAAPPSNPGGGFVGELEDAFVEAAIRSADDAKMQEARDKFAIADRTSAAWAAGKIALWKHEVERRKEQAKKYVAEAESYVSRLEWLFLDALREWARANLENGKRSVAMETATLAFRKTPAKLEVFDEEKALAWAKANCPDAVKVKESILLEPLKDRWMKTQTLPDGTEEIPESETFNVKE